MVDRVKEAFFKMTWIMVEETMVGLPQYGKIFDLQNDANNKQIGAYVSKNGKLIAFVSC